jgi:hypothetical protein
MNTTNPNHKQVTIYRVVVDFVTKQPRMAQTDATDKGGDCYWADGKNSDFRFWTRIPKTEASQFIDVAEQKFIRSQRDKAKALRESADAIDAVADAAMKL